MAKNISPEERLLALIRGRKKKPEAPAAKETPKEEKGASVDLSALFRAWFSKDRLSDPRFLRSINKYIFAIVVALFTYLLLEIFFARSDRNFQKLLADKPAAISEEALGIKNMATHESRDYSEFADEISARKIFSEAGGGSEDMSGVADGAIDPSKDLGLVGIIEGREPQAIIEDKKAGKTYYLKKGESFSGFLVCDISSGKVTIEYDGRKTALFL